MNVSFIITSYNIAPYIEACLTSLIPCLRAGDEVIVVDDGSKDDTPDLVKAFFETAELPEGVALVPVFLGANTFGGVGIAANIGLDHATREAVFFVDGDDWLNGAVFNRCRDTFAARAVDFMVTNYLEYDEAADETRVPADQLRWGEVHRAVAPEARLDMALSMIAVPWRKFYRRDFLQKHGLRFPEGDYFFEDNPFHWAVCRAANSFSFLDQVICYHRVNRPGQTMASTGAELMAFFTHYETITAGLPKRASALRGAAMRWLINNMSWHIPRLQPRVLRSYALRAMPLLKSMSAPMWAREIVPEFSESEIGTYVEMLRGGEVAAFLTLVQLAAVERKINGLHARAGRQEQSLADTRAKLDIMHNVQEYQALTSGFLRK